MCRGSLPTIEEHAVQSPTHRVTSDDADRDLVELEAFLQAKIDDRLEQHVASLEVSFGLRLQQHKAEMQAAWLKQQEAQAEAMFEWQGNIRETFSEASEQARRDLEDVDAALRRELVRDQCAAVKLESEVGTLREALGAVSQLVRDVYIFQGPERASRAGCEQLVQDEVLAHALLPTPSATPDAVSTLKIQNAGAAKNAAHRPASHSPSRLQSARKNLDPRRTRPGTPQSSPRGLRAARVAVPTLMGSSSSVSLRGPPVETGCLSRVSSIRGTAFA